MLGGLAGIFSTIFGWLADVLPDSPFADLAVITADLHLGIAWLNWFLPISEMLDMLIVWIGLCLAVTVVQFVLNATADVGSRLLPGS